jgi:hypothetical protein
MGVMIGQYHGQSRVVGLHRHVICCKATTLSMLLGNQPQPRREEEGEGRRYKRRDPLT